jgi:hypothetical protein
VGRSEAGRGGPRLGGARTGPGVAWVVARGALGGGGAHGSDVCEREAGERKGGAGYYTRLCSSGRHISQ